MRYAIVYSALVAGASAHGVVTKIMGANGVVMPGLSIADGTPRDCSSNRCGSQADTAIIRTREMGGDKASALGRTQGNGPVDAGAMIQSFMGSGGQVPQNNGSQASVGVEDDLAGLKSIQQRRDEHRRHAEDLFSRRGLLDGLLGGVGGGGGGGKGGQKTSQAAETIVADMAGQGAAKGLPTTSDQGEISMVYRQINQDGAGPLTAEVDATSGGTDPAAFKKAEVTQDVPGFASLSFATTTDYPLKVQMPQGMTCSGSAGGVNNVCIVRVRNGAAAGPFGGSAAFTQSAAARKRAIAFRLKKRFQINRDEDAAALAEADKAELAEEGDLAKRFRIPVDEDAAALAKADAEEEAEDQ